MGSGFSSSSAAAISGATCKGLWAVLALSDEELASPAPALSEEFVVADAAWCAPVAEDEGTGEDGLDAAALAVESGV